MLILFLLFLSFDSIIPKVLLEVFVVNVIPAKGKCFGGVLAKALLGGVFLKLYIGDLLFFLLSKTVPPYIMVGFFI